METLKSVGNLTAGQLVYIIDLIMEQDEGPSLFKTGVIKPLYESDSKAEIINFRTISFIANLTKIFEKNN